MLNQHHKSQLRGKSEVRQWKIKFLFMKNFKREWSANERKRISRKNLPILDYHTEPSINIKPMRIKRESPCLGLRFMPIKLSEFRLFMTSQSLEFFSCCLQCVCAFPLLENIFRQFSFRQCERVKSFIYLL